MNGPVVAEIGSGKKAIYVSERLKVFLVGLDCVGEDVQYGEEVFRRWSKEWYSYIIRSYQSHPEIFDSDVKSFKDFIANWENKNGKLERTIAPVPRGYSPPQKIEVPDFPVPTKLLGEHITNGEPHEWMQETRLLKSTSEACAIETTWMLITLTRMGAWKGDITVEENKVTLSWKKDGKSASIEIFGGTSISLSFSANGYLIFKEEFCEREGVLPVDQG